MLPYVLDATLIRSFKYWDQGVQQGMQYGHELYTHLQSYTSNERNNAYNLAFEYMEKGHQICITVSKHGYGVWKNLRSAIPEVKHYDLEIQSSAQSKDI